jgi:hypothetical protein
MSQNVGAVCHKGGAQDNFYTYTNRRILATHCDTWRSQIKITASRIWNPKTPSPATTGRLLGGRQPYHDWTKWLIIHPLDPWFNVARAVRLRPAYRLNPNRITVPHAPIHSHRM